MRKNKSEYQNEKLDVEKIIEKNSIPWYKNIAACLVLALIFLITCVLALALYFYDPLTATEKAFVRSIKESYEDYWVCEDVSEDNNQITISLYVKNKDMLWDSGMNVLSDSVVAVYEAVKDNFLSDDEWREYTVNICFERSRNSHENFIVNNIDANETNLEIAMQWYGFMDAGEIAEKFPNTKTLWGTYISDITNGIEKFDCLKILYDYNITDEEKEYVWSAFPDCVIECKDGTCVND